MTRALLKALASVMLAPFLAGNAQAQSEDEIRAYANCIDNPRHSPEYCARRILGESFADQSCEIYWHEEERRYCEERIVDVCQDNDQYSPPSDNPAPNPYLNDYQKTGANCHQSERVCTTEIVDVPVMECSDFIEEEPEVYEPRRSRGYRDTYRYGRRHKPKSPTQRQPLTLDRPVNCEFPVSRAPYTPVDRNRAEAAADDGLDTFRDIMRDRRAREIFALPRNANLWDASRDRGTPAYIIPLDRFQDHLVCENADPNGLSDVFSETGQFLFAVNVDGAPRATIRTAEMHDGAKAVEYGLPVLTAQIAEAKRLILKRFCVDADDISFVEFPALNVEFLTFRCGGKRWMTPLGDDGPFMESGRFYSARRARMLMTQRAVNHDGRPD
jgi:hypothetical protein